MGDGIDPQLINGVLSALLALLILWLKNSMDDKTSEIKERISVIDANVSHIDNTINIYNLQTQLMAQQTQTKINMQQVQEPGIARIPERIKEEDMEVTEDDPEMK